MVDKKIDMIQLLAKDLLNNNHKYLVSNMPGNINRDIPMAVVSKSVKELEDSHLCKLCTETSFFHWANLIQQHLNIPDSHLHIPEKPDFPNLPLRQVYTMDWVVVSVWVLVSGQVNIYLRTRLG